MSIGSPALAAYSLVLTSLNARSVYHTAKHVKYGNRTAVVAALTSLQQTPLELTKDRNLLNFIAINDQWRRGIGTLRPRNAWSVTTGSSIAWAVIAFLFTLVNSFVSIDSANDSYVGHAIGTLWLWVLCLVIGWSWVPTFSSGELKSALDATNKKTVEAIKETTQETVDAFKVTVKRVGSAATEFAGGIQRKLGLSTATPDANSSVPGADLPTKPPTNPQKDVSQSAPDTASTTQPSSNPRMDELLVLQKVTWLNRDEHRLSATFNHSRIMRYLTLVDDVFRALDKLAREKEEVSLSREHLVEVVSLILNRRGPPLVIFPLSPRRLSLRAHSPRCSKRRLWPSFSSSEYPLQPP